MRRGWISICCSFIADKDKHEKTAEKEKVEEIPNFDPELACALLGSSSLKLSADTQQLSSEENIPKDNQVLAATPALVGP